MKINNILTNEASMQLMLKLREVNKVVVTAHRGPDGDAMGSALAWGHYLRSLGKKVTVIFPNPCPDFLRWLPGCHKALFFSDIEAQKTAKQALQEADLICLLDFNALHRVGEMVPFIENSKAYRIMIDHHENPDPAAAQTIISQPTASSTCEMVFRIIAQLGGYDNMSSEVAVALCCGMMTDTGCFAYASNDPEIYLIMAQLLKKGADKDKIYKKVYQQWSPDRLKFYSYILSEKLEYLHHNKASIMHFDTEEMKRFNFVRGDSEGLVNEPLKIKTMRVSICLREDLQSELVRISVRSMGDFPANEMAERFFNGGGHVNAAGGSLPLPLSQALETARAAIAAYADRL